jgi:hypothetical protein
MGCRPIQSKVINHAPIGFNSRSRAPDLIRAGSVSALTVTVCPERLLGSSAKSQSTKHLRPRRAVAFNLLTTTSTKPKTLSFPRS